MSLTLFLHGHTSGSLLSLVGIFLTEALTHLLQQCLLSSHSVGIFIGVSVAWIFVHYAMDINHA